MPTLDDLKRSAAAATGRDREAEIAVINLARALVARRRDGKDIQDLLEELTRETDAQRETQQARVIANATLQLECAMRAVAP